MILRILLISCAALLSPSMAKMDLGSFETLERNCFKNSDSEPFRVNGQDTPLSNTLENFIAMAEKFEAANPTAPLKDELIFFISEFLFENIKITNGKISQRTVERADMTTVDSLWDPDKIEGYRPQFADPYTNDEKCSLYFMISHSIMEKDTALRQMSYGNFSSPVREINQDEYFPQEAGVVAIRGASGPVSMSKVLLGLLVGLDHQKPQQSLKDFQLHFRNVTHPEKLEEKVDPLYLVTLGEVLMLSAWEGFERVGMAKNGEWISISLNNGERIEGFCPMVYSHGFSDNVKMLPAYSYASVRGAADGLILGLAISKIYDSDTKLSQVLRMYYSPRGIITEDNIDDINDKKVSFCNRNSLMQALEPKVQEQMKLYGYLIAFAENDVYKSYDKSRSQYDENRHAIYENQGNGFCTPTTSLDKPEELPAETFLDIIVIMDSSNSQKNFIDQQLITGFIAGKLDLRYYGSRMTVLLDRTDDTVASPVSKSSAKIVLVPVVNDTYSSSCAACVVGQANYDQIEKDYRVLDRENVAVALDQLLQEKKEAETAFSGVNGKLVIYFNYENGDGRANNNKVQGNLDRALRNLNLRHQDVLLYAVGLDPDVLKKYARNDPSMVFLGTDDKPKEVADKILKKINYAPGLLQYSDCDEAKNEKSATFENFVSPNKIQHFSMPAEYFYKSFNGKVMFESQNGLVRVCYNRAIMKPENEKRFCKDTTPSTGVEFKVTNPCKGFTSVSCSPLYFAVMGIDPLSETNGNQAQRQKAPCRVNDRWCSTLDQIKFKVSHEGIRCSGCLGLGSPPTVILFTLLFTYFLYKMQL